MSWYETDSVVIERRCHVSFAWRTGFLQVGAIRSVILSIEPRVDKGKHVVQGTMQYPVMPQSFIRTPRHRIASGTQRRRDRVLPLWRDGLIRLARGNEQWEGY
jgi:hypothetical protein